MTGCMSSTGEYSLVPSVSSADSKTSSLRLPGSAISAQAKYPVSNTTARVYSR